MVAQAYQSPVFLLDVLDLSGRLFDLHIIRPVEMGSNIAILIHVAVLFRCEEWFMRIECLDLEEPVVLVPVGLDEFQSFVEGHRLRVVFFPLHVLSVDPVLAPQAIGSATDCGGDVGVLDLALPRVALLTAHELPGVVAGVVGGPAIFEIMVVVGDQVRVDTIESEEFRHRVVEGLQRAPAAVQEVHPAGMDFTPGRHARQARGITGVECDGMLLQSLEVGSVDLVSTIRPKHMSVQ